MSGTSPGSSPPRSGTKSPDSAEAYADCTRTRDNRTLPLLSMERQRPRVTAEGGSTSPCSLDRGARHFRHNDRGGIGASQEERQLGILREIDWVIVLVLV